MKQIIKTQDAPAAIGPYNQAIIHKGILYTSGQIALDPKTGAYIDESIEAETRQVLANLKAVLDAAHCTWADCLKATIFLSDMAYYGQVNAVYAEVFPPEIAPARECIAVRELPRSVRVEISLIVAVPA